MGILTRSINTALMLAYAPSHRALLNVKDLAGTQDRLLRGICRTASETDFGYANAFSMIQSVQDFQHWVPLSNWDDYAASVERIKAGDENVLTSEPVKLLEPTSGSTSAKKLVPYTAGLSRQFRAGLQPWLHDLYANFPVTGGRSYWSVTPAVTHPSDDSTVPIGFEDDAEYLGPLAARAMGQVFAVSQSVARARTMDDFRLQTALQLLDAGDLTLVSVWNPTFFTLQLEWMSEHADSLVPWLKRARKLGGSVKAGDWQWVWPKLAVISCWADANAAPAAERLAAQFPHAHLQPKGLLATEALITIPIAKADGAVLAARSHFVEFLTGNGEVLLAQDVEVGGKYEVVVTTAGGLYRYRLGDLVEVTGFHGALPVLRFLGRADRVSDLVREKLGEALVSEALRRIGFTGFALLAPDSGSHAHRGATSSNPVTSTSVTPSHSPDPHKPDSQSSTPQAEQGDGASWAAKPSSPNQESRPHYVLYTDGPPELAERLEDELRESFHYDYARRLGQLAGLRHVPVADGAELLLAERVRRGQRLGDIKPTVLDLDGLSSLFAPSQPS